MITAKHFKSKIQKANPLWLLLLGIFTMTLSHLTHGIDPIAWVSMVPFLLFLHKTKGLKSRLLLVLALIGAWSFIVFKIITPPIPFALIFMYSVPIALFHLPAYYLWSYYKTHKYSMLIFPAALTILEWVQYTFTPLASWGVAAYSQVHTQVILQFLSVLGMAGLSFLIYWVNTAITELILTRKAGIVNFYAPLTVLVVIIFFGSIRLSLQNAKGVETITVAAVGTDSEIGGPTLPTKDKNTLDIKNIIDRTKKAAGFGAKVVVWNEAALLLKPNNEVYWLKRFEQLALESRITLVASYILLKSENPIRYENKYALIDTNGNVINTYLKHQPVPGEPATKGTAALKIYNLAKTNLGGAICYDYDFPYLAQEFGDLNADIVALPSSDWRGIDPLHTQMAAFRAIEQGHSVLRSTRFGLSAAINPYGVFTSTMSSFDSNQKIMIAQLPTEGVTTIYSVINDAFVYFCIIFIFIILLKSVLLKVDKPTNQ